MPAAKPTTRTPSPRRAAARPAFSLVELLVTMAIILILVGLVVAVSVQREGPALLTRTELGALQNAETEYATSTNQPAVYITQPLDPVTGNAVTWSTNPQVNVNAPGLSGKAVMGHAATTPSPSPDVVQYSGERFIWVVLNLHNAAAEQAIRGISRNILKPDPTGNFLVPYDGWGNPIVYVASVNHTSNPELSFLPESTRPYFASAGPDGKWGTVDVNGKPVAGSGSEDNLYSYELSK